jgi:hypothetical protein
MSFKSSRPSSGWMRGLVGCALTTLVGCTVDVDNPTLSGPGGEPTTSVGDDDDDDDGSTGNGSSDPSAGPGDPDSATSGTPATCGNGQLDEGEVCDAGEFSVTCEDYGFDGGTLTCNANCNVNTDGCFGCGNGQIEDGEACDGNNLGGQTCQSLGFVGGNLACSEDCSELLTDGCTEPVCGDGMVNGDEVCDGNAFGGKSCQTEGFGAGQLVCSADCMSIDTSGCTQCQANQLDDCSVIPCCAGLMCVGDPMLGFAVCF